MKTTRIPHAPGTPLPELAEFLAPFRVHFHRSEGPQALERYLTGLLTEHPNKNCDTIAQVVPGTSEQRLQGLLTAIDWVQVSQIPRRFASGPAGEIPPGESIVERCWRPGSPAEVSLTLFG